MFASVSINFKYNLGDKIYFIDEFSSVHQGKIIALYHGPHLEKREETTIGNYYIIDTDQIEPKRVHNRYEEVNVRAYVPENKIFKDLSVLLRYITENIDRVECIFLKPEEKKNNDN